MLSAAGCARGGMHMGGVESQIIHVLHLVLSLPLLPRVAVLQPGHVWYR